MARYLDVSDCAKGDQLSGLTSLVDIYIFFLSSSQAQTLHIIFSQNKRNVLMGPCKHKKKLYDMFGNVSSFFNDYILTNPQFNIWIYRMQTKRHNNLLQRLFLFWQESKGDKNICFPPLNHFTLYSFMYMEK